MKSTKCIIILSEKSSGSTACQILLSRIDGVTYTRVAPHGNNETMFWTKAASVLGMPQQKMLSSSVPFTEDVARASLHSILANNVAGWESPEDDHDLIFRGWGQLVAAHAPIFVEKSPQHLLQHSVIDLIERSRVEVPEVDLLIIGLVRNPMDTIHSQFRRWRVHPEALQEQWRVSYQNLLDLRDRGTGNLVIVRYEDIVRSLDPMRPVFTFCGVDPDSVGDDYLHTTSLSAWRNDKHFGFTLSESVRQLALRYGYSDDEMDNESRIYWPLYRDALRLKTATARKVSRIVSRRR